MFPPQTLRTAYVSLPQATSEGCRPITLQQMIVSSPRSLVHQFRYASTTALAPCPCFDLIDTCRPLLTTPFDTLKKIEINCTHAREGFWRILSRVLVLVLVLLLGGLFLEGFVIRVFGRFGGGGKMVSLDHRGVGLGLSGG